MSLRYKGKPMLTSNVQVDRLMPLCFCRFVAVGEPLDNKDCVDIHFKPTYPCDRCSCTDYRPNKYKRAPAHWPLCVCGHIVSEHN